MNHPRTYYTVYCAKTERVLAFGTAIECAEQLGKKSTDSFRCLVCRALQGKTKKYCVVVDSLNADLEDDLPWKG